MVLCFKDIRFEVQEQQISKNNFTNIQNIWHQPLIHVNSTNLIKRSIKDNPNICISVMIIQKDKNAILGV